MIRRHPAVSIIVVTMNTPKFTRACLKSVVKNTTVPYELIVVNNSRAKAIRNCLKAFRIERIIQNSKNEGYTRAANQGILASQGKYLCFLNSDTQVPPHWLERLLAVARKPGIGAVGPVTNGFVYGNLYPYALPSHGAVDVETATYLIDQAFQRWHRGRFRKPWWICGYCMLIPRHVIFSVGFFDERFFYGWEDVDYSQRLRYKGFDLIQIPSLFVYHHGGGSICQKKRRVLAEAAKKEFLKKWQTIIRKPVNTEYQVRRWVEVHRMPTVAQRRFPKKPIIRKAFKWNEIN